MAEQAGFDALWIPDHFHPWLDEQGQSGFVWSVIGAISQVTNLPVTTAVTCPTTRTHPAIIAQAVATASLLTGGKFNLGVGTGEALNEHITGTKWPPAAERQEMLEEAVTIIAELVTGEQLTHHGRYYEVDTARLYSVPDVPPPIYVSGFGENSARLAARIGDGFICVGPQATWSRCTATRAGMTGISNELTIADQSAAARQPPSGPPGSISSHDLVCGGVSDRPGGMLPSALEHLSTAAALALRNRGPSCRAQGGPVQHQHCDVIPGRVVSDECAHHCRARCLCQRPGAGNAGGRSRELARDIG